MEVAPGRTEGVPSRASPYLDSALFRQSISRGDPPHTTRTCFVKFPNRIRLTSLTMSPRNPRPGPALRGALTSQNYRRTLACCTQVPRPRVRERTMEPGAWAFLAEVEVASRPSFFAPRSGSETGLVACEQCIGRAVMRWPQYGLLLGCITTYTYTAAGSPESSLLELVGVEFPERAHLVGRPAYRCLRKHDIGRGARPKVHTRSGKECIRQAPSSARTGDRVSGCF